MRRLLAIPLLVVAAVALTVAPAAEAKKKPKPCQVAGSRTVASSKQARVYTQAMSGGKAAADGAKGTYACWVSSRRSFLLGQNYKDKALSGSVTPVILSGRYVAYVVTEPTKKAVRVADVKTRKIRTLDTGAGIVAASLSVPGDNVSWTTGDIRKSAPLSGSNPASCSPAGSTPGTSSDQVRTFSKPLPGGQDDGVYACWTANMRTTLLGTVYDDDVALQKQTIDPVRISGRFVVYAVTHFSTACKAECPEIQGPGTTTIAALDAEAGERRILAEGTSVDPSSLTVAGTTVSWTEGGVAKTATLS